MNYPVDMPTVEVTVGPVRHLETSKDLEFRVTFEAVHPSGHEFPGLIWMASSERFMAITQKDRSSGENMSLVLPATNAEGWKNFDGAPIDTDGGTLHTHAYQVRLAVYHNGMYISSYTIDKVFLPEGVSPVDLDDLISVPQEPGTPINFPDVWGGLVQQAEAAALAAQQAVQDASKIYMRTMYDPADMGEGWEAYLFFVRTGNIVTLLAQGWADEGGASQVITDKIPMGYSVGMQAFASAFSLDDNTEALTDTTLVWATENTLSFLTEENPAGMYYTATMVYVTLDDPPESDALDLEDY